MVYGTKSICYNDFSLKIYCHAFIIKIGEYINNRYNCYTLLVSKATHLHIIVHISPEAPSAPYNIIPAIKVYIHSKLKII